MPSGYFLVSHLCQVGSINELTNKTKCIVSQYKGTPDFLHPKTTSPEATTNLQTQDNKRDLTLELQVLSLECSGSPSYAPGHRLASGRGAGVSTVSSVCFSHSTGRQITRDDFV